MSSPRWQHLAMLGVLLVPLVGCGLKLGRAPASTSVVRLGVVEVGVAEPRLQEDLSQALARELGTRASLGSGPSVSAQVLSATASPVAPAGSLWEARMVVAFQLSTEPPVEVRLAGQRLFEGDPESWRGTSASRVSAFGQLAEQLAAEAVPVLLAVPARLEHP